MWDGVRLDVRRLAADWEQEARLRSSGRLDVMLIVWWKKEKDLAGRDRTCGLVRDCDQWARRTPSVLAKVPVGVAQGSLVVWEDPQSRQMSTLQARSYRRP